MRRERGTGSVYQTASGVWRGAYVDGFGGHRRYVSGRSKAQVEAKIRSRQWNGQPARKVLIALDLTKLGTRTNEGYAIHGEWGEPDADGFYTPTFTVDYTDALDSLTCIFCGEALE